MTMIDLRAQTRALLMCAAHCQGGHSDAGRATADVLDIPFPITMENLAVAAERLGFDRDELWPWWAKMRADQELAKIALALTPAQKRAIRAGRVERGRGYWPLYHALAEKGLVSDAFGNPLTERGKAVQNMLVRLQGGPVTLNRQAGGQLAEAFTDWPFKQEAGA